MGATMRKVKIVQDKGRPGSFSVTMSSGFFRRKTYRNHRFIEAAAIANTFLTGKACSISPADRFDDITVWNIAVFEPNDIMKGGVET